MERLARLTLSLALAVLVIASAAGAAEFSVHLLGDFAPFISGEAGSGPGAPDYSDAFDAGWGGALEIEGRLSSRISLLAGVGYERFNGDTYKGFEFDDLEVVPVYGGVKLHLFPGLKRWDPYLRLDVGMAHISSVDVKYSEYGLKGKYWDSSWEPMFAAGVGLEYRFGKLGLEMEVKLRRISSPDSSLGSASRAGAMWTVPVRVGIVYHF